MTQTQYVYCAVRTESPTHAMRYPAVLLEPKSTLKITVIHKDAF